MNNITERKEKIKNLSKEIRDLKNQINNSHRNGGASWKEYSLLEKKQMEFRHFNIAHTLSKKRLIDENNFNISYSEIENIILDNGIEKKGKKEYKKPSIFDIKEYLIEMIF